MESGVHKSFDGNLGIRANTMRAGGLKSYQRSPVSHFILGGQANIFTMKVARTPIRMTCQLHIQQLLHIRSCCFTFQFKYIKSILKKKDQNEEWRIIE